MAVYEVIVSKTVDTVYRVNATSEESALEAAQDKYQVGEEPLFAHVEDNGHRVRLIEPDPAPPPAPHIHISHRKTRRKRDFLTTAEAAEEMQISTWTVIRYINEGILKGHKLGAHWRIPRTEVERVLRGE